jgi:cell division protein FtsZ
VTTGLGGGTGTGAAPVIANLASELGALVVAVVTKPFNFEGRRRRAQAEKGLQELKQVVDTALAIPNEKLLHTVEKGTPLAQAWMMADDILRQAVQGISDLITIPGEINLDFADVRTIMRGMGMALLGTGVAAASGAPSRRAARDLLAPARGHLDRRRQGRPHQRHRRARHDPRRGRRGLGIIHDAADPDANIIWGTVMDPDMKGQIKVTVIATGFRRDEDERDKALLEAAAAPSRTRAARGRTFFRGRPMGSLELDGTDESLPNYRTLKHDLDVPTFLRKQMD